MKMLTTTILFVFLATAVAQDHDVRLSNVGGKQGRVEVLNNGQWGTVCRDGWGFFDALVVCKQLGFPWLAKYGWKHDAGNGTGPVWLSNVRCKGSETRLDECANDGWMEHQCADAGHAAAVKCLDQDEWKDPDSIGDVHLSGGSIIPDSEGLALLKLDVVKYDNYRFMVCDHGWDIADADVICRQKGFHSAHRAITGSYFAKPTPTSVATYESYLATDFACTGNESHILQCPAKAWFQDECPTGNQAGVICNKIKEPDDFQVRLVNGTNPNEGRLEVHLNGTWGSVCQEKDNYNFAWRGSNVICKQLGLGYGLDTPSDGRFGRGSGPVMMGDYISCAGGESSLVQCYTGFKEPDKDCLSESDTYEVNVICSGPIPESRHPARLLSNLEKEIGTVLIYHDGRWGAVCSEGWTEANSEVVCRELGFGPPLSTVTYMDSGPMFLSGVSCKGDEETLDQCDRGEWYQHDCTDSMYVLLLCAVAGASSVVQSSISVLLVSLLVLTCLK
ncbi:deleted in malignant brain tumors 1 protein-like [Patiria miniata]|uniref:SRCR domain-containing protein n=1 Tax=Patiria miniata TaxID=46514 RepID=A0A914BKY0_PATMI|nr:deleted in malignant brain tumors 1 protein-like [Patiria miniata]